MKALGVFSALFALDFVWAKYTFAMTARQSWRASAYAGLIILFNGAAAIGYTSDPRLLAPAVAGAVAGTFAAVRWNADKGSTA